MEIIGFCPETLGVRTWLFLILVMQLKYGLYNYNYFMLIFICVLVVPTSASPPVSPVLPHA